MKNIKKINKWFGMISASAIAFIILFFLAFEFAIWYAHDFALDYRTRDECLDTGSIKGDEAPCRALGMKYPDDMK